MARYTGHDHTDHILQLAAEWRDRCLIGDGSMLGGGDVWTPANARGFMTHFVEALDTGSDDFMTKFRAQVGGQPPGVIRIAAEAAWAIYLFPHTPPGAELRRTRLAEIWSWSGETLQPSDLLSDQAFGGIANGGRAFTGQLYQQLGLLGRVTNALKAMPEGQRADLVRDGDPFAFASWVDGIRGAANPSIRHALLYFCYPDAFERIISYRHKRLIVKTFGAVPPPRPDGSEDAVAIDRELLAIRLRKSGEAGTPDIDFYDKPLMDLWRPVTDATDEDVDGPAETEAEAKTMRIRRIVTRDPAIGMVELTAELDGLGLQVKQATITTIRSDVLATIKAAKAEGRWRDDGQPGAGFEPVPAQPVTADAGGDLGLHHLSASFIGEALATRILGALAQRKNVILQGAPGVGKTFAARRLALALGAPPAAIVEVQFHQAYGYEDFIEGFRPMAAGGFELRPGRLALLCEAARKRSGVPHVLIIDEINRGNVSRILGEAMVLIEHDKRGDDHALSLAQSGELFAIPANVHLIGLMNTADRSLAMVDYAIRRRFSFFTLEPAFDVPGFAAALASAGASTAMSKRIRQRLAALNARIAAEVATLGAGYCVGHSHFLGPAPADDEAGWYRDIIETQVAPLLQEYWADQPARAEEEVAALLKDT